MKPNGWGNRHNRRNQVIPCKAPIYAISIPHKYDIINTNVIKSMKKRASKALRNYSAGIDQINAHIIIQAAAQ